MPILFISEFSDLPITSNGVIQAPNAAEWIKDQTITLSGTSAASQPFSDQTTYIEIVADAPCSIAWTLAGQGTNAATVTNFLIPANTPKTYGVAGGMLLSAIENT